MNNHKALEIWDGILEKTEEFSKVEDPISVSRELTKFDLWCPRLTSNLCDVLIPLSNQDDEDTKTN